MHFTTRRVRHIALDDSISVGSRHIMLVLRSMPESLGSAAGTALCVCTAADVVAAGLRSFNSVTED